MCYSRHFQILVDLLMALLGPGLWLAAPTCTPSLDPWTSAPLGWSVCFSIFTNVYFCCLGVKFPPRMEQMLPSVSTEVHLWCPDTANETDTRRHRTLAAQSQERVDVCFKNQVTKAVFILSGHIWKLTRRLNVALGIKHQLTFNAKHFNSKFHLSRAAFPSSDFRITMKPQKFCKGDWESLLLMKDGMKGDLSASKLKYAKRKSKPLQQLFHHSRVMPSHSPTEAQFHTSIPPIHDASDWIISVREKGQ